jgi:facilitated trehalose transporter
MAGYSTGSNSACIGPYTGEVCQPGLRKVTGIFGALLHSIGFASFYILGIYFNWRNIMLVILWWPILCIILIIFCPESPSWLMGKGRSEDSKNCLLRLRCDISIAQEEFERISCNLEKQKQEHYQFQGKSAFLAIFGIMKQSTFLRPFLLLSFLMTVGLDFTGSPSMTYYLTQIFSNFGLPISSDIAAAIVASYNVFLASFLTVVASVVPRRCLYITGCIISGLGCLLFGVFNYLETTNDSYVLFQQNFPITKWLPLLPIFLISTGTGIFIPVTFTLVGELLPSSLRSLGSGLLGAISYVSLFIAVKAPPFIQQIIGLDGLYWVFCGFNIILLFVVYFCLPETFGVTLEDIEDHYRTISKKRTNKIEDCAPTE